MERIETEWPGSGIPPGRPRLELTSDPSHRTLEGALGILLVTHWTARPNDGCDLPRGGVQETSGGESGTDPRAGAPNGPGAVFSIRLARRPSPRRGISGAGP